MPLRTFIALIILVALVSWLLVDSLFNDGDFDDEKELDEFDDSDEDEGADDSDGDFDDDG